jgi:hypothetical protein
VLSLVVFVVPLAVLPVVGRRALRRGYGPTVDRVARVMPVVAGASVLALAAGLGMAATYEPNDPFVLGIRTASVEQMVEDAHRSLNAPELLSLGVDWVRASIVLSVGALLVTMLAVVPALRRAGAELSGGRPDEARALYGRLATDLRGRPAASRADRRPADRAALTTAAPSPRYGYSG